MDYKTQYTILKRLLVHYEGADGSSVLQDILNDQDVEKLNEVFFDIYTRKVDKNNPIRSIYDLYNLQIFDLGIDYSVDVLSIGRNDWVRTLTLVDLFEKSVFQEKTSESAFKLLNNVVLVKGETSIINDYEEISQQQRPLSHVNLGSVSSTELLERYELLHEFIFLSFTVSCYKSFLILDDSDYSGFENLLELNALKLISCLDSEIKYLGGLEDLKRKYARLVETQDNDMNREGSQISENIDALVQTRDKLEDRLSGMLVECEGLEKKTRDLQSRFAVLKANFAKILGSLPELPESEDVDIQRVQAELHRMRLVDLDEHNIDTIRAGLEDVWVLLSKQANMDTGETERKIRDLNREIDQQRQAIQSFKKSESEFAERKNELELARKSGMLQNNALKSNILQEYILIRRLEEDYIRKISDLHTRISSIELKRYVPKFIELEETITMMDSEILEREI